MTEKPNPKLRRVPSISIVIQIEQAPVLRNDCDGPEDFARLSDWIRGNPEIHRLVDDAVELHARRREVT